MTSGTFRLPMLASGPGQRRACQHETGCLARWLKLGIKGAAHCPTGCVWWAESVASEDERERATRRAWW